MPLDGSRQNPEKRSFSLRSAIVASLVLHVLLADRELSIRRLLPLIYLGAVTSLEPQLWFDVRHTQSAAWTPTTGLLFALDIGMLAAHGYWTVLCLRRCRP